MQIPRRLARIRLYIRAMRLHAQRLGRRWASFARRLKWPLTSTARTAVRRSSVRRMIRRVVLIVRWQSGRLPHRLSAVADRISRMAGIDRKEHSVREQLVELAAAPSDKPSKNVHLQRAIGVMSLFKRQPVWSVAAVTGTVVLILMLVLQLPSMFAARRVPPIVEHGEIVVSFSEDDPDAGREPTQADPFAEVPDAVTPRPGTVTSDIPSQPKPAPLLDITLLRLSLHDPNGTQNPEAEFRVSATTTGPADRSSRSSGFQIELPVGVFELGRESGPFVSKQKADDADWRRYDSKRRNNLSQPLLTRAKPTGTADNRQGVPGKQAFDPSRHSSAKAVTRVTAPKLNLLVTLPKRLVVGERCPIRIRITNSGGALAKGVLVRIQLPPALAYSKGNSLDYRVGTIPAGETRDARLTPRAISVGTVSFTVELEQNGRVIERTVKSVPVAAPNKVSRTARSPVRLRPETGLIVPCPCLPPPR